MVTRRRFLRVSGAAIISAIGVGFYTCCIEPNWLEILRRDLPIRGLPSSLQGRTLVHLSDIHVGSQVNDEYVKEVFNQVSKLKPDIVVMTGDFISHHSSIYQHMESVYRYLPKGRLTTLAILGNHDYGPRWSSPEIASKVADILSSFGVRVLRNQIHDIEGLHIVGLDDLWAGRFHPQRALPLLKPETPAIVLSHNPDTVDMPVWHGYKGWILSGHTHGGQCKPPFLPPPLLPVMNRRYTSGELDLGSGRRLYINRGVGHLLHVRFNVRPEVTVFELRRT